MAISKEFLSLFKDFVENYKLKGTPAFYSWGADQNHSKIGKYFDDLVRIIETNQKIFHDASIIEHLHSTVIVSAKTNPYLLTCWIEFFIKYNNETQQYAAFGALHLSINPEEKHSEAIIRELTDALKETQAALAQTHEAMASMQSLTPIEETQSNSITTALTASQKALSATQIAHATEVAQLRKQIEELQRKNGLLEIQNDQLRELTQDRAKLEAMNQPLHDAQKQLVSIQKLLQSLQNFSEHKVVIDVPQESEADTNASDAKKKPAAPPPPPPPPPLPEQAETKLHTDTTKPRASHEKIAPPAKEIIVDSAIKPKTAKIQPQQGQSFFAGNDEIKSARLRLKTHNATSETTAREHGDLEDDGEKKKWSKRIVPPNGPPEIVALFKKLDAIRNAAANADDSDSDDSRPSSPFN